MLLSFSVGCSLSGDIDSDLDNQITNMQLSSENNEWDSLTTLVGPVLNHESSYTQVNNNQKHKTKLLYHLTCLQNEYISSTDKSLSSSFNNFLLYLCFAWT